MNKTYRFQFCTQELIPSLTRRPWWNIFGRDKIDMKERTILKSYIITEREYEFIAPEVKGLIREMMGTSPHHIEIEELRPLSQFFKAGGDVIEFSRATPLQRSDG